MHHRLCLSLVNARGCLMHHHIGTECYTFGVTATFQKNKCPSCAPRCTICFSCAQYSSVVHKAALYHYGGAQCRSTKPKQTGCAQCASLVHKGALNHWIAAQSSSHKLRQAYTDIPTGLILLLQVLTGEVSSETIHTHHHSIPAVDRSIVFYAFQSHLFYWVFASFILLHGISSMILWHYYSPVAPAISTRHMHLNESTHYESEYHDPRGKSPPKVRDVGRALGAQSLQKYIANASGKGRNA